MKTHFWVDLVIVVTYVMSFLPAILFLYFPFRKVIEKKKRIVFVIGTILLCCLMTIVSLFLVESFGMSDLHYKLCAGAFYFFLLILMLYCSKETGTAILFNFGCIGIVILSVSGLACYVRDCFPVKYYYLEMNLLYFGIMACVSVPFYLFLRHNTKLLLPIKNRADWSNIWFLPVSIMVVCALSSPLETHVSNVFDVIARLMCGILAIFLSQYLSHNREAQREKGKLMTELSSQKESYKALSKSMQDDRRVRHDFRHAILAIRSYIDEDDKDGLTAYCEKLLENSVVHSEIPFLGNSVVDGILYRYTQLCKEAQITFETEGVLTEDIIEDMDMCVLLGNLMENALEACKRMKGENKWIHVGLEESEQLLTITISNSYEGKIVRKKDSFLSFKRSNEKGIGLQSVKRICEKYHGTVHVTYDDEVFNVMLLLNVKSA